MRRSIVAVVGVVLGSTLSACATDPSSQGPVSESSYVTGSNIPRRDGRAVNGVTTGTVDSTSTRAPTGAR